MFQPKSSKFNGVSSGILRRPQETQDKPGPDKSYRSVEKAVCADYDRECAHLSIKFMDDALVRCIKSRGQS